MKEQKKKERKREREKERERERTIKEKKGEKQGKTLKTMKQCFCFGGKSCFRTGGVGNTNIQKLCLSVVTEHVQGLR